MLRDVRNQCLSVGPVIVRAKVASMKVEWELVKQPTKRLHLSPKALLRDHKLPPRRSGRAARLQGRRNTACNTRLLDCWRVVKSMCVEQGMSAAPTFP